MKEDTILQKDHECISLYSTSKNVNDSIYFLATNVPINENYANKPTEQPKDTNKDEEPKETEQTPEENVSPNKNEDETTKNEIGTSNKGTRSTTQGHKKEKENEIPKQHFEEQSQ